MIKLIVAVIAGFFGGWPWFFGVWFGLILFDALMELHEKASRAADDLRAMRENQDRMR